MLSEAPPGEGGRGGWCGWGGLIPDLLHKSITVSLAAGSARLPGASEARTLLLGKEGLTASRSNHSSVRRADKSSVNHL